MKTLKLFCRNDFLADCYAADKDERFAAVVYSDMLKPHIKDHLMNQMGAAVLDELTKIFRNKSDILENVLRDLLHADFAQVLLYATDFKQFMGMI